MPASILSESKSSAVISETSICIIVGIASHSYMPRQHHTCEVRSPKTPYLATRNKSNHRPEIEH